MRAEKLSFPLNPSLQYSITPTGAKHLSSKVSSRKRSVFLSLPIGLGVQARRGWNESV